MDDSQLAATAMPPPVLEEDKGASSTSSLATGGNTSSAAGGNLDPCSKDFNPELALRTTSSVGGLPEVTPFPSLKQFESYYSDPEAYKKREEESQVKRNLKTTAKLREDSTNKESTLAVRPYKMKNVMIRMANTKGPLSKLRDWMLAQVKVKVIIRSFKGIRGTCTGFVAAFDRYLNLAMTDVDEVYASLHRPETYVKRKRGSKKPTESHNPQSDLVDPEVDLLAKRVACLKVNPCDNVKQRHVNQLFIRGDQIVLIYSLLAKPP